MTQNALNAMEAYVEQILAEVPAGAGHKAQMREELIAHLLNVFDEELARAENEAFAVHATLCRFGAASELHDDFDTCVSFWERTFYWLLELKEQIMWRLVVFAALGVIAVLVGLGLVMPAVQQMLYHEVVILSVVLLVVGLALSGGGVWSFVHGVRRFRARNA